MDDKDKRKARLEGIQSALDKLEAEHATGNIDVGRYLRLKTQYETLKAALEQGLDVPDDVLPIETEAPLSSQQADGHHIAQAAQGGTAAVGDGNVVGNGNVVIKQQAGNHSIQIGQARDVSIVQRVINLFPIDQKITNFFFSNTEQQRAQQNRQAMLQLVRNTWIKGVLEQSLHGAAMIELGMEERADAVEKPWDMVLQMPNRPNRTLPPGTKMVDVYDEMNGALLILGEPGSGKTTMLLELARETIDRAEQDSTQPISVVFNLSSWAARDQTITDWLVDELSTNYHIPKKIARPWIENDDLLLLLDGLDEVKAEKREDCVKAINDFRQEHLTPLVVCSRVADYETLTNKLKLQGAVLLQPLTLQQVDQYLADTGLQVVRAILQHDPALQELAQSPLMFSTTVLAYRKMSFEDLQPLGTTEVRRKHLFNTYTRHMLEWRGRDQHYSTGQVVQWLAWLAKKMSEHEQSMFLIEQIQPIWLQTRAQRRLQAIISRLMSGLMAVWFGMLTLGVIVGYFHEQVSVLYCVSLWLMAGLSGVLSAKPMKQVKLAEALRWSWREALIGLIVGIIWGWKELFYLLLAIVLAIAIGSRIDLLGKVLIGGGIGWLIGTWIGEWIFLRVFGPSAGLSAYPSVRLTGRLTGQAIGRMIGSIIGGWGVGGLWWGLILMLAGGLAGGLIQGLMGGLRGVKLETRTVPSQGIRHSLRSSIMAGFAIGIIVGTIGGIVGGLGVGLSIGLITGFFSGRTLGGSDITQHFILRFVLYRTGRTPWNLVRFLDYATERIFLRKVGGGYIFIHRSLLEYFAELGED